MTVTGTDALSEAFSPLSLTTTRSSRKSCPVVSAMCSLSRSGLSGFNEMSPVSGSTEKKSDRAVEGVGELGVAPRVQVLGLDAADRGLEKRKLWTICEK